MLHRLIALSPLSLKVGNHTLLADRIEKEMQYPGEIKISVIRETRVIEYAR